MHRHLVGGGNPDVYADVKYGKHVRIYAFPDFDATDDDNETLKGFCAALGANESYNARVASELADDGMLLTASARVGHEREMLSNLAHLFAGAEIVERELCGNDIVCLHVRVAKTD